MKTGGQGWMTEYKDGAEGAVVPVLLSWRKISSVMLAIGTFPPH